MYATNSGGEWRTEVVDSIGNVGRYNSIAVDSMGKVHISYYDATTNDLKYAKGNFGEWSIAVVDSVGVVGEYNSISCDSSMVYITYLDYSNSNLKFAVNSGSGWSTSVAVEDVGLGNSQISSNGKLHVAFLTADNRLSYASMNNSEWSVVQIDTSSSFGKEMDIGLKNGQPCIAYYDTITHDLKLAIRGTNNVWSKLVIDDTTDVASWLSLDTNSGTGFHITYYDYFNQNLCYAVLGDEWEHFILDTSVSTCSAIVSDYNGKQHVVYIDIIGTTTRLSYITNSGAKWMLETVDENGTVGQQSSLAVDAEGHTHIAYYDSSNGSLNYANNIDGWNVEVVDNSTAKVGQYPSLALDAEGNAHISYYDAIGAKILKYATNAAGDWNIHTLDGSGDVGMYSSIGIDGNGKVHIAYLNSAANNLKYTSNAGGDWIIGLIDNSGTVDGRTSLAIDSLNQVHVAYYRAGELIHANQVGSEWAKEPLESTDQLGGGVSMFIDDQDQIYVTYYNTVLTLLKYINNVGGQWNSAEIIEADGIVGVASTIKVDENGDAHIAYVDNADYGILKYVEKRNGIWMFQKVDLQGCGDDISMALDAQGRAHVSYYNPVTKDLMYASSIVVPTAPTNLTVTVSDGLVTLNWEAPQNDGGSDITEYQIFRSDGVTSTLSLYSDVSHDTTVYNDLGVENGVSYIYRVRAVNSEGGSSYSNQVIGTPCTLPDAPDLKASGRDKSVVLEWDEPDNGGAAIIEYKVYRKNETGMWLLIGTVNGTETKYTDTGLENGVEYSYYVTAVNPSGEGPESGMVSATANPDNTWMIIIVAVIILAAVGVGAFLLLRQKGKL